MPQINHFLAASQPSSTGWLPIAETDLLILVGVTGVGKSTTADALQQTGTPFQLLPNRRTLTDQLIISALQIQDNEPIVPIKDRAVRFAYTRRYREQYPGGMAHALAQLWVCPDQIPQSDKAILLFDGLRGANEVQHAANLLPQARFLVLDAPHFVRVQRLLGRSDSFDTINNCDDNGNNHISLPDTADLFTTAEKQHLHSLVTHHNVNVTQLQSKISIVLAERQNYDPQTTIIALQKIASHRTWVADTVTLNPTQIAQHTLKKLLGTAKKHLK